MTQVSIIGAGLMGAGIAQVFATSGIRCRVYDPLDLARDSFEARVLKGCGVLGLDASPILALVDVVADLAQACEGASLVIEAGPENLDVKRSIFSELSRVTPPDAILASNTSAIPIGQIAAAVREASRVVGTHFWNPPYLVPLVEVVQSRETSVVTVDTTMAILASANMKPVHVKVDVPGFVGNRMQHALKREAIALVADGVCSAETVDMVVRHGFGRRLALVGPLEQADLGGTDLTLAIHQVLMPSINSDPIAHPYLEAMVARGDLGAKSGRGFFTWSPGDADRRREEINRGLVEQSTGTILASEAVGDENEVGDE